MSAVSKEVLTSKSAATRQKLVEAGIRLFSEQGFEATSTRQVQEAADVQRNLITYHFGGKDDFWKACMVELFRRISEIMAPAIAQSKDIEQAERIRFLVRRYVRASAAHPEIARVMFDEGRANNWRLDWLVENYVRPFFDTMSELYAVSGLTKSSTLSAIQLHYLLVSSASVYAMAPEYQKLSGKDPFDETLVDEHANVMADLLTTKLLIKGESER